ncbi:MAG: C39 family peptidase [Patescibacteria group bacterium]|nr:C39 family peptidase [Patescibacteria group bacterium]
MSLLRAFLLNGTPVIVGVRTGMNGSGSGEPHFMLLTGMDENNVYVNDP